MKVLVIDNDMDDRESILTLLHSNDDQTMVHCTDSVDEGIRLNRNGKYDIVLLNYDIPEHDGIEALLMLRDVGKNCRTIIIMMSHADDEQLAIRCLKAGAQDFIPKSEITIGQIKRAMINANIRHGLERELRESYEQVKKLAGSDALTGLVNRYVFDEELQSALISSKRYARRKVALLIIDVDNFKHINDSYGHATGDQVLQGIVQRTKGCLRGGEVFARLGGDEFAIIVSSLTSAMQAGQVATRVRNIMLEPFNIKGWQLNLTVSIGIALFPDNSRQPEELTQFADVAMYRSKKLGRNRISFYQQKMQSHFADRFSLEQALRQSIDKHQLLLHYLPCYKNSTYEVDSVEALLRWNHPEQGLLYPDQFLAIAEESLQILTIGRWVLEEAIGQLAKWNREPSKPLSMIINLSVRQFSDSRLVEAIENLCRQYGVSPDLLQFELTETSYIEETKELLQSLSRIAGLGCKIALDDFGIGYSSISHIRNLPINTVKIDRSLICEESTDDRVKALINGLVMMLHSLGLTVVMEGVETQEHADFCKELGADKVQGHFFAKSVGSSDVEHYLQQGVAHH